MAVDKEAVVRENLMREFEKHLADYESHHNDYLKHMAEYRSIHLRVEELSQGDPSNKRDIERKRALDKAKIVLLKAETCRADRASALIRLESVRFRTQVVLDLPLAPMNLPEA